ncbi:Ubiquitin-fold modifier-conjugating enzyme 1 [Ophiophagus hannah]|uniref:Ubiquitin-fold modifier-conjugating enzyme 1 n=1 Tax=Ophiophagus hannah TaxID=8665 RepID=V8N4T5_OPHHA|nr:Ubiquitin-fold modifier-conjugating enzyme 1 [Ophiophagus hannah]
MADEATRRVVAALPLLKTNAGPRDQELWIQRLKEEYQGLIKYVENNKNADNDWFRLESNKEGTRSQLLIHLLHRKSLFQNWMAKQPKCTGEARYA